MALTVRTLRDQEEETRTATSFTMTERVCLNADKSAVVDCNSEAAHFSLGGVGTQIPMADAERYGLAPTTEPKAEEPETKMVEAETKPRAKKAKT